jgi:hypothetical protein
MTTAADALILRYLQDLESELGDLPANRRQELLDEVHEHITAARADLEPASASRPGRAGRSPRGWRSRPSSCW